MTNADGPVDPRIAIYRDALDQIEAGHLDVKLEADRVLASPKDEIALLGESIISLAASLTTLFEHERKSNEISREIAQGITVEDVLERIYSSFSSIIPYNRIGCALLERNGTIARAHWARTDGRPPKLKVGYSAKMAGSSLQAILESGEPRIINDLNEYYAAHPQSMSTRLILAEGARSSLTCPLVTRGRPTGFLFFSSNSVDTYAAVHQDVFMHLADLMSVAIEKSVLYSKIFASNQALEKAQVELTFQASHDSLTGLLNHAAILEELADRTDNQSIWPYTDMRSVGVLMLDIDNFKSVNDTYGHPTGDQVLRSVADILALQLRSSDRIGRYGGEEFLVTAEIFGEHEPIGLAERLRVAIARNPIATEKADIPITISVGVAIPEPHIREGSHSLIRRADRALYLAKQAGRDRVVVS